MFFNKNDTATIKNISIGNDDLGNVFSVNKYGVPVQAHDGTDTTLMVTSQAEPENYNNIKSINASVKSQLKDVWNNYFYNGSLWINTDDLKGTEAQADKIVSLGGDLHISVKDSLPRGSTSAFNITMETYFQVGTAKIHEQDVNKLNNCFTCHNAGGGSTLMISHLYNGHVGSLKGLSKKEIKQNHIDQIKKVLKARM